MNPKTILFSGTFSAPGRAELEAIATANGFKIASGVTKKLDYLVAGERMGPAKKVQAVKQGVAILSAGDFLQMTGMKTIPDIWAQMPGGGTGTGTLLAYFETTDWQQFDPHTHGEKLRDTLLAHEAAHGITDVHHLVSGKVRAHLKLLHPYGHDDEWQFHAVSPDGKWLATGSWMGKDYETGGVLQVWEIAAGRIVNAVRIGGGVGWPDFKAFEWSPDSSELAIAYDTNTVGVWNPFSHRREPRVYANITDGWSRPPYFTWYPDGKAVFIRCALFDGLDRSIFKDDAETEAYFNDDKNGCRLDTFQRMGNMSAGVTAAQLTWQNEDDRKREGRALGQQQGMPAEKNVHYYKTAKGLVAVTKESAVFYGPDGNIYAQYTDRDPGTDLPTLAHYKDFGEYFDIHPAFGIQQGDEAGWALAFNDGVIIAPAAFDAPQYLNWSLGNHWHWPLQWCGYERYGSLQEWDEKTGDTVLHSLWQFFLEKANKAPGKKTDAVATPAGTGIGYDSLRALTLEALDGLGSGWNYSRGKWLAEMAICDIANGTPEKIADLLSRIPEDQYAQHAAEVGFYCLKAGYAMPVAGISERLSAAARHCHAYNRCIMYAWLSMYYYQAGDGAQADAYAQLALDHRLPENNEGGNGWPLINMLFMNDRDEEAIHKVTEWALKENAFYMPVTVYNLGKYKGIAAVHTLIETMRTHQLIADMAAWPVMAGQVILHKAYDRLLLFVSQYDDWYGSFLWQQVVDEWIKDKDDRIVPVLTDAAKDMSSEKWRQAALLLLAHYPDVAVTQFKDLTATLKEVGHQGRLFAFSHAVHAACLSARQQYLYNKELTGLPGSVRAYYTLGKAAASEQSSVEAFIGEALKYIEQQSVSAYELLPVRYLACSIAFDRQIPYYDQLVGETLEIAVKDDKDLSVAEMVNKMIAYGDLEGAYKVWLKIPKGSRYYRMNELLRAYCRNKNYEQLYKMLMGQSADDYNGRPAYALAVLVKLSGGRDVWLKF